MTSGGSGQSKCVANGAEQLRLPGGDLPVRLDRGSTGDDDAAL